MFARSGTVSSPGALAVSSPERVRRAHRFLIKAASKSVDRAGSRDQAIRIGVTANVGEICGGAQYSVDQLVAHLSAEVNHRLGLCGMPCAS
jgi:hypothetical protein